MLQSTLYFLILGLVVFSPAVSALGISGSSTIQPIIEQRIPLYTAQGGEAVTLKEGGSGNGIINPPRGPDWLLGDVRAAVSDKIGDRSNQG